MPSSYRIPIVLSQKDINRFNSKYTINEAGCWQWLASKCSSGYGTFGLNYKTLLAHRISYTLHKGLIPENMVLDHLCRKRACVNPHHLEAVTEQTNILRGNGVSAKRALQTHCKNGHEFSPVNTYVYKNRRQCRICINRFTRKGLYLLPTNKDDGRKAG